MTSVSISLMKKQKTTTLGHHHGGVRLDTSLMTGRVCGAGGERGRRDPSPLKQNLGDAPDLRSYYIKLCLLLFYQRKRKKRSSALKF